MLAAMIARLKRNLRKRFGHSGQDDYNWIDYHHEYRKQQEVIAQNYTQILRAGDFWLRDGVVALKAGLKPLHPNCAALYATIGRLAPGSVIEVGCGGGDHLHNLGLLHPGLAITGFDRSQGQLDLLAKRHPRLAASTGIMDLTVPGACADYRVDLVYSQAVIMHIKGGDGHRMALVNMLRMARRHVVLVENFANHPFVADIRDLHRAGASSWPALHFHVMRHAGARVLVASGEQLAGFDAIDSDAALA